MPAGSLAIESSDGINRLKSSISMFIGSNLVSFPANFPMAAQDVLVFVKSGNTNDYPLDKYGKT
jgi:hypothetical protein